MGEVGPLVLQPHCEKVKGEGLDGKEVRHRVGERQDRTGQDRTGQDRTGQDRTGQDRRAQNKIENKKTDLSEEFDKMTIG